MYALASLGNYHPGSILLLPYTYSFPTHASFLSFYNNLRHHIVPPEREDAIVKASLPSAREKPHVRWSQTDKDSVLLFRLFIKKGIMTHNTSPPFILQGWPYFFSLTWVTVHSWLKQPPSPMHMASSGGWVGSQPRLGHLIFFTPTPQGMAVNPVIVF